MTTLTKARIVSLLVLVALTAACGRHANDDGPSIASDRRATPDRALTDRPARGSDARFSDRRDLGLGPAAAAAAVGALLPLLPLLATSGAGGPVGPVPPPGPRPASGVPPAGENRLVPNEVVIEVAPGLPAPAIAALEQRQGLLPIDQFTAQLSATTLLRAQIPDGRGVAVVIAALETDPAVLSAQPNYRFALQALAGEDTGLQYALAKLRLPQAHALATGGSVLAAVIDSGIDTAHPELAGAFAGGFDALEGGGRPDGHGTAIAGLIAAHARLTGAAPGARLLAVRAFDADAGGTTGASFAILKGLDWAATQGARVVNMSFAGPPDPALHRALAAAHDRGITLVAAAGNAGPASPPLYPGADPAVIAVSATDADDRIFADANRGGYIAVAAPGVDLLVAAPNGAYRVLSGTSLAAAEVSGIAALMLQRAPGLGPDALRATLLSTAAPLPQGIGLADAYGAVGAAR